MPLGTPSLVIETIVARPTFQEDETKVSFSLYVATCNIRSANDWNSLLKTPALKFVASSDGCLVYAFMLVVSYMCIVNTQTRKSHINRLIKQVDSIPVVTVVASRSIVNLVVIRIMQ